MQRAVEADYLDEAERQDRRIYHGVWLESDLDSPERAARASLVSGDIDNAALKLDSTPPLDRADAAVMRGEYKSALSILDAMPEATGAAHLRGARIRADALVALGRTSEAVGVADAATKVFAEKVAREPDAVVEAVRLFALLTRVRGPATAGSGGEYHAMMSALDEVHNNVDKLHWPTLLAQAELLYEKDNAPEAAQALQSVLALNPSCAEAWAMLGRMSVDSFNFAMTEAIATRLDMLAEGRAGAGDDGDLLARDGSGGVSLWAAIIRARAGIRQGDPAAAADALAPALARYPRERELLALHCAEQALRYDPPLLERALAEFEQLAPGSPMAHFEVGKALGEARQYEPAAEQLNIAHDRLPKWADPVIELGLLEVQYGRIDKARDALEVAVGLDPFNVRADNSLRLVKELLTYSVVQSEHYTIRYKPGVDEVLAREMAAPLERNYAIVTGKEKGGIDFEPPIKTTIDLMPDHKWFAVRIAGMPNIHTIAAATGACIAMEAPREGRDHYGTYDWVRVLRHEFTHTVTLARTFNRIPHWFTEAAAVYLEQSPRDFNTCRLLADVLAADQLFDFNQINIAFVRPARPTDRQQAYAQGHWMYEFIIDQWGDRAPLDLMDLYAKGQREEAAFQSVLGISREEFLRRFKAWAREQVVAWGLALPEGTPRVQDMLVEAATTDPERQDEVHTFLSDVAEQAFMLAMGVGDADANLELTLPDLTPELTQSLLEKYPDHPDLLELAVKDAAQQDAGPGSSKGAKSIAPEAVPLLERYAAARPVDPLPHQLLANLYLNGEHPDPDRAVEHLEYLDAREQYQPVYAAELARRYAARKDWDKAWAKVERATQIAAYDPGLRELAATIALKRSDLAGAERHVSALVLLEPDVAKHEERLQAIRNIRDHSTR